MSLVSRVRPWTFSYKVIAQLITTSLPDLNALYDNSAPFMKYLKNQGIDDILRNMKLELRERHTVVPHVCGIAYNIPHAKR